MKTKVAANCHECEAVFVVLPEGFQIEFVAKSTGISVGVCPDCQAERQ